MNILCQRPSVGLANTAISPIVGFEESERFCDEIEYCELF